MNEIKHTRGPWKLRERSIIGPLSVTVGHASECWVGGLEGSYSIGASEAKANARLMAAAPDMAEILEIIAADADAGEILMTSGVRMALDAALIKAGRKEAPARAKPCKTCGGTRVVDDGEITGSGGVEFENGPIKCVKDCPDCQKREA